MLPTTSTLSQTLRSITVTKIREIEKQRLAYEERKSLFLDETQSGEDLRDRIAKLLSGVKDIYPESSNDINVSNIARWLGQSRHDATISSETLQSFEDQLLSKLNIKSRKLDMADLYSRLLTEWMNSSASDDQQAEVSGSGEDSYVVIERQKERLRQLCDDFERVVFEPLETDEVEIDNFLRSLFEGDGGLKALERVRSTMRGYSTDILDRKSPFGKTSLSWCIKGLLAEDLLSEDKQSMLHEFLESDVVLAEIADVLNMRYADVKNWEWEAGDKGIPVMPRQQLNGKYRIWMDEDILQAIFIHYIGVTWCIALKSALRELIRDRNNIWRWTERTMTQEESDRYQYWMGFKHISECNVRFQRQNEYDANFFLAQLPASVNALWAGGGGYDNDGLDNKDMRGKSVKQKLLRHLTTEILLARHLHGKVAVAQTDLKWYATGLPHGTIFACMRFIGFSEEWITFFKKFLEAPLNLEPCGEGRPSLVRIRKRGVPMAHAPEKLLGELVLFFMDLAVNKSSGLLVYRLHDDIWLCGDPERCSTAWSTVEEFLKVMRLELNIRKTGSIYITKDEKDRNPQIQSALPTGNVSIGLLLLNESGEWAIDQDLVTAHMQQLHRRLEASESVISWIRTWNGFMGRFLRYNVGHPSYSLGPRHIDNILETYARIQRTLFDAKDGRGSDVVSHLKQLIASRFDHDVPDAFLFLPEQCGGLGLQNPFVSLALVRSQLDHDPQYYIQQFLGHEKNIYASEKERFEALSGQERRNRSRSVFSDDGPKSVIRPEEMDTFMSFEEFSKWRESASVLFGDTYTQLLKVPSNHAIRTTTEVRDAVRVLNDSIGDNDRFDDEKEWILQYHADELFQQFGGLQLVDKAFLPLGVLTMMRNKKVKWQMIL